MVEWQTLGASRSRRSRSRTAGPSICSLVVLALGACGSVGPAGQGADTSEAATTLMTVPETTTVETSTGGSTTIVSVSVIAGSTRPTETTEPVASTVLPTSTRTASTTTAPPSGTGAYGFVTAGPTCPVEQIENPCPDRPLTVPVTARDSGGTTIATAQSDATGLYRLGLPPGQYTLSVSVGSMFPRCPAVPITVGTGPSTRVDIGCDTGIR